MAGYTIVNDLTITLKHPELAADQLRMAHTQLGLRGAEISTTVAGRDLSDPELDPFWPSAQETVELRWVTAVEVATLADPAYAIRVADALTHATPPRSAPTTAFSSSD